MEFEVELRSTKGFPLFSALRMAFCDTIILLIVDYRAAVGGKNPRPPPLRTHPPDALPDARNDSHSLVCMDGSSTTGDRESI